MTSPHTSVAEWSDEQKTEHIKTVVTTAGQVLRQRYPVLQHQDAIGVAIMAFSLLGMVASGWLYVQGHIAWWVCVPVTALFASLIHELEHDLIHLMYFRNHRTANNLMLALGWLARASTVSPFVRRKLHMHHHKYSGTESDLEERGITNGERWGLKRFLMLGDNMLAVYLRPTTMLKATKAYIRSQKPASKAEAKAMGKEQLRAYFPLGNLYYALFHTWVLTHAGLMAAGWMGFNATLPAGLASALSALDVFAVVYMLPCLLRTFCLHFVSSNMHYYGDVEPKNILQQCQVLNVWWMAPFNLFCFNFGSTHAIHHFVVKEPFYIRQLTAPVAHRVMREMGVRFNDVGTFARANRWTRQADVKALPAT